MGKLYLVTGAAGHLGSTVVRTLCERGERIRALVLPEEKCLPDAEMEIFRGDVCDKAGLNDFFGNPGGDELVVIHCAGVVSIATGYNKNVYDVNVTGTKNIVDMCLENNVSRLVYVSSVHAIPEKPDGECITGVTEFDPGSVMGQYAKTKTEATAYVLDAVKRGLNASVVHPSGISGPYDSGRGHLTTLVTDFCRKRLTAAVNGGYDFVDVRDVAQGIISCCEKGRAGECYILSNRYLTVRELLNLLHEITGLRAIKTYLPLWFAKLTAPLAEMYYKLRRQPPLFTPYSLYTLGSNANFSHAKATAELGYKTTDIRKTLSDTFEWLKKNKRV